MIEPYDKTRAVVLHSIHYSDSSLIVKMLTEEFGLQSYIIKGVFRKNAKIKPAFFQNMTLVDIIVSSHHGNLGFIKEISLSHYYKSIYNEIQKKAIIIFLSELLSKSIQGTETDKVLFKYVYDSMLWLDDTDDNYANFPLVFAIGLSRYLGFYPNIDTYADGFYFDLLDGRFKDNKDGSYHVDKDLSRFFYQICLQTCDNMKITVNNSTRRQLMNAVMIYYKLHIDNFKDIRSFEILKNVIE